jgi:hypothetical protein
VIEISLTQALILYSVLLGGLAMGIWLYTELSVRRPQRKLGRQFLWKCAFCGCTYLDEQAERVSQCPRCENFSTAAEAAQAPSARALEREPERGPAQGTSGRKRKHQRRRGPRRRRR